jgi:ligand-binding sensor domain-containing protein/serine phosphatase RsbU (regulator of sigma subunit)
MERFLKTLSLVLLLNTQAIQGWSIVANGHKVRVDLFNVDRGLPQTAIMCLFQDSQGFIWLGTQDGLCRYDGYGFATYRNNPLDTGSIQNNYIYSIAEDRKGRLWIGTGGGLSMIDRKTYRFRNFRSIPGDPNSLSGDRIYFVYEDRQGSIWAKTHQSLDRIDPGSFEVTRFTHYNDLFTASTDLSDFSLYEDSRSQLWVGTKDGLMLFDRQLNLFKRYAHDPSNPKSISNDRIKAICEDGEGNLWVGTENGLNRLSTDRKNFTRYYQSPANGTPLPGNVVNDLQFDRKGFLWIGTDLGLCSFDTKQNTFTSYRDLFFQGEKLALAQVTSIIEDKSGILWIGTLQGLIKWDRRGSRFKSYSSSSNGSPLFSNNFVASIFQNDDGNVWVGTWGAGLHIFNPKTLQNIRYSSETPSRRIVNNFVHVICKTRKGEILIGTRDGVQLYQPDSKRFVDYFSAKGIPQNQIFSNNRVYAIVEDARGNLWIGTRIGLHRVSSSAIRSLYYDINDSLSISSNEVYDVIIDSEGLVWVGTRNGLNCIDPSTLVAKRFFQSGQYTGNELISDEILCLHQDRRGLIWIGTVAGLHRYDKNTGRFELVTSFRNLPSNLVNSIEEDDRGNIWVSTNWGIAMFNPITNEIKTFDVNDGIQSQEFNIGSSYKSRTGEIFFGGISGYSSFYPDSLFSFQQPPPIAITTIEVFGANNREVIPADGLSEITLNRKFSLLTIEFAALDFTRPEKNAFRYRMEGLEDQWIDIGTRHSATFSHLQEGVYHFRVVGANSDLVWNDEGKTIKITVVASFWETRLAFILYGVLLVLAILVYLRSRTRNLRRTKRLLKEREFVMAQLEKQKEELMLKNKNITDSINYAKRIQEAIMPSVAHFKKLLPDSFILYMPKDIVSGDFYWVNETHNKIFVAVIDCTGHGVPGAFMSIIGVELLRNITNNQGIDDASEILNRLNIGISDTFAKGINEEGLKVKDGMDVAFCVVDKENNTLQYAGAFSNMFLIRDSKITEIKGDRYSVGMGNEPGRQLFSSHYIPIQPDDMIYIFTDGYVDQFGGPEGKKYKFRRFRHLLLNIHKFPLETQRQYLIDSINEWKGSHEQVDDILIIGIKPDLSCLF